MSDILIPDDAGGRILDEPMGDVEILLEVIFQRKI